MAHSHLQEHTRRQAILRLGHLVAGTRHPKGQVDSPHHPIIHIMIIPRQVRMDHLQAIRGHHRHWHTLAMGRHQAMAMGRHQVVMGYLLQDIHHMEGMSHLHQVGTDLRAWQEEEGAAEHRQEGEMEAGMAMETETEEMVMVAEIEGVGTAIAVVARLPQTVMVAAREIGISHRHWRVS